MHPTRSSRTATSPERSRSSTGRSSPWPSAWRRRPGGSRPSSPVRCVGSAMADNAGLHDRSTPIRRGRPAGPAGPRRRPGPRRRGRRAGQPGPLRAPARRGVGGVGGPAGGGGHRGADRGRPRWSGPPGADPRPPGAGRGRDALRRPSRRVLRAGSPGGRLRRGHPLLDRRRRRGPRATSTPGPGSTCSDPPDHAAYLRRGWGTIAWPVCGCGPTPSRGGATPRPTRSPDDEPISDWEVAASPRRPRGAGRVAEPDADAVLAGAGVANLAAWVAVARANGPPADGCLTAELGLWGYTPTPADPYIFNHRVFPGTSLLADASTVLGMVVGGPGTTTVGCLGAAEVDRHGNLNSTPSPGRPLPGGVGRSQRRGQPGRGLRGGDPGPARRLPDTVAYVTAPGDRVTSVVTDRACCVASTGGSRWRRCQRDPTRSTTGSGRWWALADGSPRWRQRARARSGDPVRSAGTPLVRPNDVSSSDENHVLFTDAQQSLDFASTMLATCRPQRRRLTSFDVRALRTGSTFGRPGRESQQRRPKGQVGY